MAKKEEKNEITKKEETPIQNIWTNNEDGQQAISIAMAMRHTKIGLYAAVPIICKENDCPYAEGCPLMAQGLSLRGQRCPIEIATIEDLFQRYCTAHQVNPEDPKDAVDLLMIKDLVDTDIGILRCDEKFAIDADYVINNTVGVSEDGVPLTRQELHPLTEYREKLVRRKNHILTNLNSTRKAKNGSKVTIEVSPSEKASQMLNVIDDMKKISEDEKRKELEYKKKYLDEPDSDKEFIDVDPIDLGPEKEE
jgi:hypothetical protein